MESMASSLMQLLGLLLRLLNFMRLLSDESLRRGVAAIWATSTFGKGILFAFLGEACRGLSELNGIISSILSSITRLLMGPDCNML